jgi:hypothetical protein
MGFPCCASFLCHACCYHYPGGSSGCSRRSLHPRQRPSPLVWRVGTRNGSFGACSVFTRVAARVAH